MMESMSNTASPNRLVGHIPDLRRYARALTGDGFLNGAWHVAKQ